jgi:gamma-glutamylcysteine synthetase
MPAAINSKLDIMNIALVALGTRPATSPTEQRGPVQFANARYEGVRDYVLTTGNWNCATKRATLSQLDTTPGGGGGDGRVAQVRHRLPTGL